MEKERKERLGNPVKDGGSRSHKQTRGGRGGRVIHGGYWDDSPGIFSSSDRTDDGPSYHNDGSGFRLARTIKK